MWIEVGWIGRPDLTLHWPGLEKRSCKKNIVVLMTKHTNVYYSALHTRNDIFINKMRSCVIVVVD